MIPPGRYMIEVHDVYPGMAHGPGELLAALPKAARRAALLLVVPNWGGSQPLDQHPDFLRELKKLPGEKVLHGYTHLRQGRRWWNFLYHGTENHSEFFTTSIWDAHRRIQQAKQIYRRCFDEEPRWFCAPRWQQNVATERVLRQERFVGYMLYNRIVALKGRAITAPAVCFDEGARAWKIAAGRLLRERQLKSLLQPGAGFRFTLHPTDPDYRKTWRQLNDLVLALETEGYKPITLDELWEE